MRTILCLPFISVIEKMSSDKKKEQNKLNNNNNNNNLKNMTIDGVKCTNIVKQASAVNDVDLVKQDTIRKLIFLSGLEDNALWYDESSFNGTNTSNFFNIFSNKKIHYDVCFERFD